MHCWHSPQLVNTKYKASLWPVSLMDRVMFWPSTVLGLLVPPLSIPNRSVVLHKWHNKRWGWKSRTSHVFGVIHMYTQYIPGIVYGSVFFHCRFLETYIESRKRGKFWNDSIAWFGIIKIQRRLFIEQECVPSASMPKLTIISLKSHRQENILWHALFNLIGTLHFGRMESVMEPTPPKWPVLFTCKLPGPKHSCLLISHNEHQGLHSNLY